MRIRLLTLRYAPCLCGFDERPLADFVRDKEVISIREHFFSVHDVPHLACLVAYEGATAPAVQPTVATPEGGRPWRGSSAAIAELSAADRSLYDALREWRSARARQEGVPPYVLFTNRELLALVRFKPRTPNAMQAIDGIGAAKVQRHGAGVLAILHGSSAPSEAGS